MKILRNILSLVVGWAVGSFVNMGLIKTGHSIFPIPGIDPDNMEAMAEMMPTLGLKHFIFPFLAHALGTLVGAIIAGLIAATGKMRFSLAVGIVFLIGGIIVNYMLTGPTWFVIVDLVIAYIPMAWIGGKIALKLTGK